MKKPQVWHYHYDSSGHARKHLHFGGRVRHEHVNLTGYGQFTSTLHENEKDSGKRRVKYFGRSTPSRIDAETAMNPKRYTLVATVRSKSRPGKMYEIKIDENGILSCNCPVWLYKKGGARSCRHVKAMESIIANPGPAWHLKARDKNQQILSGISGRDRKNYWMGQVDAQQISLDESVKHEVKSKHTRLNNPGAARHRQEAVSLYKEARGTDSERRKAVLQIRAVEHVQSAIESDAEGIPNPKRKSSKKRR